MGLTARILGLLGGIVLRTVLLAVVLFGVHLLLSRAIPELQETASALEREPLVTLQLEAMQQSLEGETQSVEQLEQRLAAVSAERLRHAREELEFARLRLQELDDERQRLLAQLDSMQQQRDAYCSSYNPLKRWMCRELDERLTGLRGRLEPLLDDLKQRANAGNRALEKTRADLALLEAPELSPAEKLRRLDDEPASALALQLGAARGRLERARAGADELQRELRSIQQRKESRAGWLLREWNAVRTELLTLVAVVLALPYVQRTVSYFVLMPLLSRLARPLRLSTSSAGQLSFGPALRSLPIELGDGQYAQVRAEYARPVQGKARSRLLYDWRAPFISYASGLRLLTYVDGAPGGVQLTLAAPSDPNAYLMRIDLEQHPGVVVHPKHVVGVLGAPQLSTRWRLFSVHAWATWQLRFIAFHGTGAVIVEGHGDLTATLPGAKPTKIEQQLVVGFDARLSVRTARTETFLPYLLGKTALVDDVFSGEGPMLWQKSNAPQSRNPVTRSFDALFSALGKLLGF